MHQRRRGHVLNKKGTSSRRKGGGNRLFKYRIVSAGIRSSPSARKAAVIKKKKNGLQLFRYWCHIIWSSLPTYMWCYSLSCMRITQENFYNVIWQWPEKKEFSCDCDISVRVAMFYINIVIGWFFILLLGNFHEMVVKVYRMRWKPGKPLAWLDALLCLTVLLCFSIA